MEPLLARWHKEIGHAAGVVCYYIIKRKASKAGLREVAFTLERVAAEIKKKFPE
jgi:hypothetical protein